MPRLVVVDDDSQLAEELAGLFGDVGYDVTGVATDAVQGIALVAQTRPDVVVMDVRMEGMSGTEAAGVLGRQHPGLPVVLLSAYSDEGIQKAAQDVHVAAYLVKGCSAGELLSTVGAVIKQSQAQRSRPLADQARGDQLPGARSPGAGA
jgi:DNA-binding NarL/FixJ family response regulator